MVVDAPVDWQCRCDVRRHQGPIRQSAFSF